MFDYYFIIAAILNAILVGAGCYYLLTRKNKSQTAQPQPTPKTSGKKLPTLEISGALRPPGGKHGFLALFGLGHAPVYDVCYLTGPLQKENLAPNVSSSLAALYGEGDAIGSDVMQFLHHGKVLSKSEVLCFALLAEPNRLGHRVVAFVDALRFPPCSTST